MSGVGEWQIRPTSLIRKTLSFVRPTKLANIDCGREYFKCLGENIGFAKANDFELFVDEIA